MIITLTKRRQLVVKQLNTVRDDVKILQGAFIVAREREYKNNKISRIGVYVLNSEATIYMDGEIASLKTLILDIITSASTLP